MKFTNLIQIAALFFLFLSSCTEKRQNERLAETIKLRLNSDSSAIELRDVPAHIIEEFLADSLDYSQWSGFFAVYEESRDPEMRDFQPALSGTYIIDEGMVRFQPDSAFRKGRSYFSRCYTKLLLREPADILGAGKLSVNNSYIELRFSLPDK